MKKLMALILALTLILALAACGGQEEGEAARPGKGGDIISVVHPDFQLTDGFIEPVERQDKAPEGFIPISTASEFCKIGLNPAANYILMADIDLAGMEWEKISDFSGTLEGNGYTVSNAPDTLFLSVEGGTVRNLGVRAQLQAAGASMVNSMRGGALLYNCWFEGSITSGTGAGLLDYSKVGGLVFSADGARIISCRNGADLYTTNVCGGIVGEIREAVTVKNCLNTGSVTVDSTYQYCDEGSAGGIVGQIHIGASDGGASNVTNCRNSGPVSGVVVAGILGDAYIAEPVNLYIRLCCNEGNIYAEANGFRSAFSAGIVNVMLIEEGTVTVSDCYNTGAYALCGIEGGECLQRSWDLLSEDLDHVRVERCFNTAWGSDGAISRVSKNLDYCYFLDSLPDTEENATQDGALFATVRQLSEDEMTKKGSFEGFDFDNIWEMGDDHPVFSQPGYEE